MADQPPTIPNFRPGDFVFFGRFKNKAGILKRVYSENGTIKIEIEPVPKGRKKSRTRNLFSIRLMPPEDAQNAKSVYDEETKKLRAKKTADVLALKVAARFNAGTLLLERSAESNECLLAVKALARFAASIDKATIDRWKRDLKGMTKIYRDLVIPRSDESNPDRSEWDETRLLFRKFRANLEEWTYKVLLPRPNSDHPESPLEKSIRSLVWDLRFKLDDHTLFPTLHGEHGVVRSPNWMALRHDRDKNVKRYQASAIKAFKEIEIYLGSKPAEQVERRDAVDHFEVSGIQVVVRNYGRAEMWEKALDAFLRNLKRGADQITRAGFGRAVKGLTVTVDFDPKGDEGLVAGTYQYADDTLRMLPLGMSGTGNDKGHGTFTHECGHRFYFKALPGPWRAHWEEVMESRGVKITPADVDRFADLVVSGLDASKSSMIQKEERLQATVAHAKDQAEAAKFAEMATLPPKSVLEAGTGFDARAYRDKLKDFYEGTVVQLEEITDYANTNATEAFAECFREWILKGPRALGPWTRGFFKEVCRAGGAKLASKNTVTNHE